jgi:Acyclic terpene utilisation family protein AtuA
MTASPVRVLVPAGMLGAGFTAESISRGIALGADAIAIDGGSTDSGPAYLATASAKMPAEAIAADLRLMLTAGAAARIPVIIGSAGTSGTDAGVDWIADIVDDITRAENLNPRVVRIYSEQSIDRIGAALADGKISPLPPAGPLDRAVLQRCDHVVGLMGAEPIVAALQQDADVVVAGRATDTALIAALPLRRGCPPGPAWHAAKIAECGGQCTTNPRGGGVLVAIDDHGFTVEPLEMSSACTPRSVAAHMLYENADPFVMREPSGSLDVTDAAYTAVDDRVVRVTGSKFIDAPYTVKLEGAGLAGYQTLAIAGIRDPEVLSAIEQWTTTLHQFLTQKVGDLLGLAPADYHLEIRCYGWNAVLGDADPDTTTAPREVGAVLLVTADAQETATKIVKLANPYLLHMPLPGMSHLPCYAFMASPAEIERGPIYEFLLQHVVSVDSPDELFRGATTKLGER